MCVCISRFHYNYVIPRSIPVSNVSANWISQLLACIGFLPQGRLFYLMKDRLNLELMNRALGILEGAELAVTRSVVSVNW